MSMFAGPAGAPLDDASDTELELQELPLNSNSAAVNSSCYPRPAALHPEQWCSSYVLVMMLLAMLCGIGLAESGWVSIGGVRRTSDMIHSAQSMHCSEVAHL